MNYSILGTPESDEVMWRLPGFLFMPSLILFRLLAKLVQIQGTNTNKYKAHLSLDLLPFGVG